MSDFTKKKKNYIRGSAKQVEFADGGILLNVDLNLQDLNNLPVSDKGYVRLSIAKRSAPDTYGNSHYVYENAFVPDKSKGKGGAPAPAERKPAVGFGNKKDLPF
jgi:hypothetical protein